MNALEIFGICFISEIAIIVIILISGFIIGIIDKKIKEKTYKHMLKFEQKLKSEKYSKSVEESKIDLTEIGVLIPKGTNSTSVKKLLNLSDDESVEYTDCKVSNYICYSSDGKKEVCTPSDTNKINKITKTNDLITIDSNLKVLFTNELDKVYHTVRAYDPMVKFNIKTGDIFVINNENVDIQLSVSCKSKDDSYNKKEDVKSENINNEDLNKILENAVINEDEVLNSENTYRYEVYKNDKKGTKTDIKNYDPDFDDLDFKLHLVSYREDNVVNNYIVENGSDEERFAIAYNCGIYVLNKTILTKSQHQISICIEFNPKVGYAFLNKHKTSKEIETVCFDCIRTNDNDK